MPGRRLLLPRRGDTAEYLTLYHLSRVAQVIAVPRQEDFGVDVVGSVLHEEGALLVQGARFEVQVKSGGAGSEIRYGGRRGRKWLHHEVRWLLEGSPLPLFIGKVNLDDESLELYTTTRVWRSRATYGRELPTEIRLRPGDGSREDGYLGYFEESESPPGDGNIVGIPLGRPVVILTPNVLNEPEGRRRVASALERWCRVDDWNRLMARIGVPAFVRCERWEPNEPLRPADIELSAATSPDASLKIERIKGIQAVLSMALWGNNWLVGATAEGEKAQREVQEFLAEGRFNELKAVILGVGGGSPSEE